MRFVYILLSAALFIFGCSSNNGGDRSQFVFDSDSLIYSPKSYVCYKTLNNIVVDGDIATKEWEGAPWSDLFVDIEGDKRDKPLQDTRVKMLWNDTYLYIAADLKETDVWAYLTERESAVFYDNDFEVFIDPDGDSHTYFEYEVNALGTIWDRLLIKPYRDMGSPALSGWNFNGMQSAVKVYGTINDGDDIDQGWTVELAIPISSVCEGVGGGRFRAGDQWRVNFSRVEWATQFREGKYHKVANPNTGVMGDGSEYNWVWSPQGMVNMHAPETWGFVQFSDIVVGRGTEKFMHKGNEDVRWALRRLYYRQRDWAQAKGAYATNLKDLRVDEIKVEGLKFEPKLSNSATKYEIFAEGFDGKKLYLTSDGKIIIE